MNFKESRNEFSVTTHDPRAPVREERMGVVQTAKGTEGWMPRTLHRRAKEAEDPRDNPGVRVRDQGQKGHPPPRAVGDGGPHSKVDSGCITVCHVITES